MAMIFIVTSLKTKRENKFIDECLSTFPGSIGYGGKKAYDPRQAAFKFAWEMNLKFNGGFVVVCIDTQEPDPSGMYGYKTLQEWELGYSYSE